MGQLSCPEQCCSALVLHHCTPVRSEISIGLIACLHSSTEQRGSCLAMTSAALLWSCIISHLYEEQISTGVIALAQACCEASLQSSTEQQEAVFPEQCCIALVLGHCTPL